MMLAGPELRVVPVTIHIPLADVPRALTTELIVTTGKIVARDLERRFGIAKPRIAVAGLNPHAGEEGMLGPEDAAIVRPAVEALVAAGVDATGPLPADTMFHAEARKTYDAALCMYHDQALIPIKTLAFDDAVNVTLGLPFVRTSPDHGTALVDRRHRQGAGDEPDRRAETRGGACRGATPLERIRRARSPAAASRGDRPARLFGQEGARSAFSSRPQSDAPHRARRRAARRLPRRRGRDQGRAA